MMIAYIDAYKDRFGVEAICRVLGSHLPGGFITGRSYRRAETRPASARSVRDSQLIEQLEMIHAANYGVYGVRKMWHAMRLAGWQIGREQSARLTRIAGLCGARRGRTPLTTRPANKPDMRPDLVNQCFKAKAPNELWVADITYVRTRTGFVYTAFVTGVFSRMIVGWSTRSTMRTDAPPQEALDQAITQTQSNLPQLVHHSDHG